MVDERIGDTMHLPAPHRELLEHLVRTISADERVQAIALGGSFAEGGGDEFSDLDLVLAVEDDRSDEVSAQLLALVDEWGAGATLAAFTGEHIGQPRLVIALMAPVPLHVDFLFLSASDYREHRGPQVRLFERIPQPPSGPQPVASFEDRSPQWFEDRFWGWVHYGATKLGRGELFEALQYLEYVRGEVLAPLMARRAGLPARGMRHLESRLPADAEALTATLAAHEAGDIGRAIRATVELYRELRADAGADVVSNTAAEAAAMRYLDGILNPKAMG